jgi:Ca2+-binding RTX toxin-like protein
VVGDDDPQLGSEVAMGRWTRFAVAGSLGVLVAAVVPAAAGAQPPPSPNQAYWVDGDNLRYQGGISKTNQAVITNYGTLSYLIDDVTAIVPGAGCVNVRADNTKAICTKPEPGIATFAVNLGMGHDTLEYNASFDTYVFISGGTGNDAITIGSAAGHYVDVDGDSGDDTLQRPVGTAFLRLDGGEGDDTMCGAAWVTYEQHTQGVHVTVGGPAGGDGADNEADTVCAAVLGVTGTAYADILVAGSAKSALTGEGGDDLLVGGPQNDFLYDYLGNDTLVGNAGDDRLNGGAGSDALYAGTGTDECWYDGTDALHDCETLH